MTEKVHDAILALLVEGGVERCTFTAVADRAGVERSTLYRRYPDRWEMMIDAFIGRVAADVMPDSTGSFVTDLRSIVRRLRDTLETPLGPAVISLAAAFRAGSATDYSRAFFDRRMEQLKPMFEAAIARGELPEDVDRESLFTFAAGPIYFRMFIAARRVEDDFIDSVVEKTCASFGAPCR